MMDIVFCINNNWIMQCGICISSIIRFNNKENLNFHIIGKDITIANVNLLKSTYESEYCHIQYYNVPNNYSKNFVLRAGDRVTIETYYRFFIPSLLEKKIDKALYIDADIICVNKLDSLFKIDITNYSAGMVLDSRYCEISKYNRLNYDLKYGYFNAGVMLINLDYWRNNDISQKLIDFVSENKDVCYYHDQDAINACLHDTILKISPSYNVQTTLMQYYFLKNIKSCPHQIYYELKYEKKYWPELEIELSNPVFIHFTEFYKPWHKSSLVPFTKVWRELLKVSPWNNFKLQKRIYPKQVHYKNQIKRTLAKLKNAKCIFDSFPKEMYEIENKILEQLKENTY